MASALAVYFKVIRPELSIPAAVLVYFSSIVASSSIISGVGAVAALSAFLFASSSLVIGDFINIQKYRITEPQKPILSRKISLKNVAILSAILMASGLLIALFISSAFLFVSILSVLVFSAHSWKSKDVFLGEASVALLLAFMILSGGLAVGDISKIVWLSAIMFFVSIYYQIERDVADFMNNKRRNDSIVTGLGIFKSRRIGEACLIASIASTFVPFAAGAMGSVYMFFAIISDILLLTALLLPKVNLHIVKAAAALLVAAFLVGSLEISLIAIGA